MHHDEIFGLSVNRSEMIYDGIVRFSLIDDAETIVNSQRIGHDEQIFHYIADCL